MSMDLQQAAMVFIRFRGDVRQWLERNTRYNDTDWEIRVDGYTFQLVLGVRGEIFHFKELATVEVAKHWGKYTWDTYMQNYVTEGLANIAHFLLEEGDRERREQISRWRDEEVV